MQTRPVVIVPLASRGAFLAETFGRSELGGMFVPSDLALSPGEEVDIELAFLDEQVRFRIRGTVEVLRQASESQGRPPGFEVSFSPEEEATRELLLAYAAGRDLALVERDGRRFGARLKVKMRSVEGSKTEATDDISEGGAFILTDELLPIGTTLDLTLQPPGALFGVGVRATVAWVREEGRRGVGVEFSFDSPKKREQVVRLVGQLKERIKSEVRARAISRNVD